MAAMYVEYIRRAFETIVVFMFLQVMLQLCGGHAYFVNYFTNFKPSSTKRIVLYGCYVATIQFIVVIFLVANVAFVLEGAWGLYGENQWRLDRGYLYCKILVFASTAVGFGSLFVFYHHTKHYLLKYEIVKKFLCIKILILLPIMFVGFHFFSIFTTMTLFEKQPRCSHQNIHTIQLDQRNRVF